MILSQSIPFSPSLTVDSMAASLIKKKRLQNIYIFNFVSETSIKLEKGKKKKKKRLIVLLCYSASIASFDPVFHNRSVQSTRYQQVPGLMKSIQDYVVLSYWEDDFHYLS